MNYPAAIIKNENEIVDMKLFRHEAHRARYIEKRIKDILPDISSPMSRNDLDAYTMKTNEIISYLVIDAPLNGGRTHWPYDLTCPICETMEIFHYSAMKWDAPNQCWKAPDPLETGHCLDCNININPKEVLIAITLEP